MLSRSLTVAIACNQCKHGSGGGVHTMRTRARVCVCVLWMHRTCAPVVPHCACGKEGQGDKEWRCAFVHLRRSLRPFDFPLKTPFLFYPFAFPSLSSSDASCANPHLSMPWPNPLRFHHPLLLLPVFLSFLPTSLHGAFPGFSPAISLLAFADP